MNRDFENIGKILEKIEKKRPLIHCISNIVSVNDCANIVLSIGASPTMAHHVNEVEEITGQADALMVNLGATENFQAIELAVGQANKSDIPVIIDPVGVGASGFRRDFLNFILKKYKIYAIRGNMSEMLALAGDRKTARGVDDEAKDSDLEANVEVLKNLAYELSLIVTASGPIDIVTDGKKVYRVSYGSKFLSRVTGSGCMSSCVLAGFLSVDKSLEAVKSAVDYMGICGQVSESLMEGKYAMQTYKRTFMDQFGILNLHDLESKVNYREEK